jgi:hypothetical protein
MNLLRILPLSAILAVLATAAHAQFGATIAPRLSAIHYVTATQADQFLRPGDIMLKRLNDQSPNTSVGISISETMIQNLNSVVGTDETRAGDPQVVHAAIYLGNNRTAEAHGETPGESAGVSPRDISHHVGYLFAVYRPTDAALGAEAAAIAKTWATGRMGYLLPFSVPFHSSDFGPNGRAEAFEYGAQANVPGGPRGRDKMFCSQFVLAAYQAAYVQRLMKANPKLDPNGVTMYPGVDRQASFTSPLVMSGHLNITRQGWTMVGFAAIQAAPPAPPNPATPQLPMVITTTMLKGAQGRCLVAVPNPLVGKPVRNSPVIEADCTGRPEAKWRPTSGTLVNEASGLCLSINDGRLAKGQGLLVWDCHGGPDQAWVLKNTQIALGATGLCANGQGFKGTPVLTGSCDRNTATTWQLAN